MGSIKAIRTKTNELDSKRLETSVTILKELKEAKARADLALLEFEAHVVDLLRAQGRKTFSAGQLRATLVQNTRMTFNEASLAKTLGAKTWNKITKKVLDKPSLEKLMALGEIDPVVVSQHSESVPNKPYIRISTQQDAQDE